MFTVDRKRVVAFCEALLESGEQFHWGCSARTDCIDDELIELMASAQAAKEFSSGSKRARPRMQKIVDKGLDLRRGGGAHRNDGSLEDRDCRVADYGISGGDARRSEGDRGFLHGLAAVQLADPQLCLLAPLAETPIHAQHKPHLIFDDVISDMSFQGWTQDPLDREMIAQFPEHLSELLLGADTASRSAVPQGAAGVPAERDVDAALAALGLHQAREAWSTSWPSGSGGGARPEPFDEVSSSSSTGAASFTTTSWNSSKPASGRPRPLTVALSALVAYEAAFDAGGRRKPPARCQEVPEPRAGLRRAHHQDTVPLVVDGITVTTLSADYPQIVRCLRRERLSGRFAGAKSR